MECTSTIVWLCTCTTCFLSETLLHTGKAETTSLDETGDNIVLSEQEATEDKNKEDATMGNPQEEDLVVGDSIDTLTEAVGKMRVGGGSSTTNKPFSMDYSFPYQLYNYEAKDQNVITVNFLFLGQTKNVSPCVTDGQNVLELGVNIPAVFADRGLVQEADSNLAHNTHKLTAFKDLEDEIFEKHADGLEEQCIHSETHNKSSYPSWGRNRSRNGLLTIL